jgi:hypothetical protein
LTRALIGLLIVLVAAAAHFLLIFAGVYRRYPVEWWAVALLGVVLAAGSFRKPEAGPRVVAAITILLLVVFVLFTTVLTRIKRPELAIVPGQTLASFTLFADDDSPLAFPAASGPHRATLLVFFRGVW